MANRNKKQFTVKEVAEISNVSVRTLHFYDEIGLLKPAFVGENNYRYYEEEQLLLLQQILFYRELGFPLAEIQRVMESPDFNKIQALEAHRTTLAAQNERTHDLIRTIDRTLDHLKKGAPLKETEIYLGFDPTKQAEYEKEIKDKYGDRLLKESKRRTKNWARADYENVKIGYDQIHREMTVLLERGVAFDSAEAHSVIDRHFEIINRFYTPTREVYVGLGQMYCEHPEFRKLYDSHHPKLAEYMRDAMRAYAEKEFD